MATVASPTGFGLNILKLQCCCCWVFFLDPKACLVSYTLAGLASYIRKGVETQQTPICSSLCPLTLVTRWMSYKKRISVYFISLFSVVKLNILTCESVGTDFLLEPTSSDTQRNCSLWLQCRLNFFQLPRQPFGVIAEDFDLTLVIYI